MTIMRMFGAALAVALLASPAAAHQAPAGWQYDRECCSTMDCQQVADGVIREVAGGYRVVIQPGAHIMLPADSLPAEFFVPHGDARIRPSGDQHRHACIARGGRHLYCIYVPLGGV